MKTLYCSGARSRVHELSEAEPGVKYELGQRPHKQGHDALGNFVREGITLRKCFLNEHNSVATKYASPLILSQKVKGCVGLCVAYFSSLCFEVLSILLLLEYYYYYRYYFYPTNSILGGGTKIKFN